MSEYTPLIFLAYDLAVARISIVIFFILTHPPLVEDEDVEMEDVEDDPPLVEDEDVEMENVEDDVDVLIRLLLYLRL